MDIAFVIRPEPNPLRIGATIWRAYILQDDGIAASGGESAAELDFLYSPLRVAFG